MNRIRRKILGATAAALATPHGLTYAMMKNGGTGKVPLFLTAQCLMQTNGSSVQTKIFTSAFHDWLHFHWASEDSIGNEARSIRLEAHLPESDVRNSSGAAVEALLNENNLSWWEGNRLKPEHVRDKLAPYRERVGAIYAAPGRHRFSSRLRFLIEYFGKPFVLHFWDFLDGGMEAANDDTKWLLARATKVYVLSKKMHDEISPHYPQVDYLMFTREKSRFQAKPPNNQCINIALIGFCKSPAFSSSLAYLKEALSALKSMGIDATLTYIGSREQFGLSTDQFGNDIRFTGFKNDNDLRDAALADAHVAFLSGPSEDPESDPRSKYSVTSRILDFMAVGLPTIAVAHPDSATADFLKAPPFKAIHLGRNTRDIVEALVRMTCPEHWLAINQATLEGFALYLASNFPKEKLKEALTHIGRLSV